MSNKETPAERVKRLSETVSPLIGIPIGLAECGCPNNTLGAPPVLHICQKCGFEGSERLHENCAGCLYKNPKNDISDRWYPR